MQNIMTSICLFATMLFATQVYAVGDQNPYYSFFPSKRTINYKKFVHNIFGFSIDMPSTWVFGINGMPPTAVVFLYRSGMNTGKLTEDYETIEIGKIPFEGMPLIEAQETVMRGMKIQHPNLTIVKQPAAGKVNELRSISWIYEWLSKTGYTVVEYVTLVQSPIGIRSLAVRTTRRDYLSRMKFYDGILQTFDAFRPKY